MIFKRNCMYCGKRFPEAKVMNFMSKSYQVCPFCHCQLKEFRKLIKEGFYPLEN